MVLRVQEVLLLNSCGRAVEFDQLKVKGLDGQTVSSQVPDDENVDLDDSDSDGMEDDDDDDGDEAPAEMEEDPPAAASKAPKSKKAQVRKSPPPHEDDEDDVDSDGTEGFEIYDPETV